MIDAIVELYFGSIVLLYIHAWLFGLYGTMCHTSLSAPPANTIASLTALCATLLLCGFSVLYANADADLNEKYFYVALIVGRVTVGANVILYLIYMANAVRVYRADTRPKRYRLLAAFVLIWTFLLAYFDL